MQLDLAYHEAWLRLGACGFANRAHFFAAAAEAMRVQAAESAGKLKEAKGWDSFLLMLALISVNLGLINLLPIPVLDGGHLMVFAAETVLRRPLPERVAGIDLFQRLHVDPASCSIVRYTSTRPYVLATNTHEGDLSWLAAKPATRGRGRRSKSRSSGSTAPSPSRRRTSSGCARRRKRDPSAMCWCAAKEPA